MRLLALAAVTFAAAAVVPSEAAAAPVLDGKRVKVVTRTVTAPAQQHDAENAALDLPDRLACAMPRCYRLDFVYAPAKGVTGDVLFAVRWASPAADVDLYVATWKNTEVAHCGAVAGTGELLVLPAARFKPGRRYTLVADFFRAPSAEQVTARVELPATRAQGRTVPSNADTTRPPNCALDAS